MRCVTSLATTMLCLSCFFPPARADTSSMRIAIQDCLAYLPFIILVFDEFADLVLTGRNEKRNSRTGLRVWPGRATPPAFISCWQRSALTGQ